MAHGRARDERKEQQWRRWIGEWQASGLSARAFCQRRGLALPTFYAWRRTLERAPEPSASRTWPLAAARPIPTTNAN